MDIDSVLARHTDRLIALPGVVGIGEGEQAGTPAVIVMVSKLTPELKAALPAELEGHPVIVDVTGEITAFGVE